MDVKPLLRRYTDLAPLLYLLQKRAVTVLSPRAWDDRNDSSFLEAHKRLNGFQSVLALCFTEAAETYHHWRVFSGGLSGVCLEFDKARLTSSLSDVPGLRFGPVTYKTIQDLEATGIATLDLPFIKRYPYRDEYEFRLVLEDATASYDAKDIPFSPSALQNVVVNPWMPKAVFESVQSFIKAVDGWKHLKVRQTTLIDNERWRQCVAAADQQQANQALQPTSRASRKAKSKSRSRPARG